jgi:ArsR family transcriptional regulator, lead/cadmium/zinc/bismuth-responsive transcriptional repressor
MEAAVTEPLPACDSHAPHTHPVHRSDAVMDRAAVLGAALGDPARLRLLELLLDGRHCVSELAEESSSALSTVSQRLKVLTAARLVHRRREGRHIYYTLADDHVRELLHALFDHASE